MKILLLGDASNYHATLAHALRLEGHDVTLASSGSGWMRTHRDIDISRKNGKLGGAILWARLNTVLSSRLKGYDVVQLSNPVFIEQRPQRVEAMFRKLRRDNGGVFLTALGTDTPYVDMCLDRKNCPLRYSEWHIGQETSPYMKTHSGTAQAWQAAPLRNLCDIIYNGSDGVLTALYEYHLACTRLLPGHMVQYAGIPITIQPENPSDANDIGTVNLFIGRHRDRMAEKGTDILEDVARQVAAARPGRCRLDIVENRPYSEYISLLNMADIVFDQLYSYTPATNALLAMSMGKVTVSGGEEDFYNFIGESKLRPIVNANPADTGQLISELTSIVDNPDRIKQLGRQGRMFVRRHNDASVVAKRFTDFWERRLR